MIIIIFLLLKKLDWFGNIEINYRCLILLQKLQADLSFFVTFFLSFFNRVCRRELRLKERSWSLFQLQVQEAPLLTRVKGFPSDGRCMLPWQMNKQCVTTEAAGRGVIFQMWAVFTSVHRLKPAAVTAVGNRVKRGWIIRTKMTHMQTARSCLIHSHWFPISN